MFENQQPKPGGAVPPAGPQAPRPAAAGPMPGRSPMPAPAAPRPAAEPEDIFAGINTGGMGQKPIGGPLMPPARTGKGKRIILIILVIIIVILIGVGGGVVFFG